MTATAKKRVGAGVPTGGQFVATGHTESGVTLDAAATPAASWPDSPSQTRSIVPRESVFTQRYDTVEEKPVAFQSELEGAVANLADDDEWNSMLDAMSKFPRYSFGNQMLIALQTKGQATRVAGFRRWEEMCRLPA